MTHNVSKQINPLIEGVMEGCTGIDRWINFLYGEFRTSWSFLTLTLQGSEGCVGGSLAEPGRLWHGCLTLHSFNIYMEVRVTRCSKLILMIIIIL